MNHNERAGIWVRQQSDYAAFIPKALPPDPPLKFDQRMIRVTHTSHQLAPALYQRVKEKFESYLTAEGANFLNPQRVDLFRKVG